MFEMADDEESVEKALMTLSWVAITSQDSVNRNLVPIMVDRRASGHYSNDVIIRDLNYRLQDYVHLAMPRKVLTAGGALLDVTVEDELQGLVTHDYGNQILIRVDGVVIPSIERSLFSATTTTKKSIGAILDSESPSLEGISVIVLLRSESSDLYLFVLDLSADGYGPKELAMIAVTNNSHVRHRRLGHLHEPPPGATSPTEPLPGAAGGASSGGTSPSNGREASPGTGGLLQAPVPATARRGTAMRKQDSFTQRCHVACCRGADGRVYPL